MKREEKLSRRGFIKQSAALAAGASLSAKAYSQVVGANGRIRVGFIGVGNRGSQVLESFMPFPDVEVAALCDVYEPYLLRDRSRVEPRWLACDKIPKMGETFPREPLRLKDFRKVLDQKDIDAVCIATPDHWHAIQTIAAVEAGKDVYVEKPLTITIQEGRKMIEAAKRTGRVVQVGLNRHGSFIYQDVAEAVKSGRIGKVVSARGSHVSNMYPKGIGKMKPEEPPKDFDWDMWLGPRASRPYQYNIAPYYFRWWKEYSSQLANNGVHFLDAARWIMGEKAPVAVSAHGGKYGVDDDRTIPDTLAVTFEFASGCLIQYNVYEACSENIGGGDGGFFGAKGTLVVSREGYEIIPAGPGQFQDWNKLIEPEKHLLKDDPRNKVPTTGYRDTSTVNHVRDFLDCVKSRKQPRCPIEEGHLSTCMAHIANIALEMKMRLEWDAEKERFTNSEKANEYLSYEYRKPWKL